MPRAFIRSFKVVHVSWLTKTDPGILDWGVQTLVQKGLLNFLGGKLLLTEMTTCFSIFERRSPVARETLLCSRDKESMEGYYIFEYSWNLVQWQNATRVSLKQGAS